MRLRAVPCQVLDSSVAAAGLATSISTLCLLQNIVGFKLFVPPMMASAVIFFTAPKPPPLNGFLVGTLAGVTVCDATFETLPDEIKYGIAGGVLLLFYKFTNSIFPPAVIIPVLIAQNGGISAGGYS